MKLTPSRRTIAATIRGSVPDGKLAKAHIVQADSVYSQKGGFTQFNRETGDVEQIGVPTGDSAYAMSVRGHETRHAAYDGKYATKPAKKMLAHEMLASNFVDDVRDETRVLPSYTDIGGGLPALRQYCRDHLATAYRDIANMVRYNRNLKAGLHKDCAESRNMRTGVAARVLAMLNHYEYGDPHAAHKGKHLLRDVLGGPLLAAISRVVSWGKHESYRERAISLLTSLMENPEAQPHGMLRDGNQDVDGELFLAAGDASEGNMRIVDLRPKNTATTREKSVSIRHAPSGAIVNVNRFVAALVSGDGNGLFSRRVKRKPGGTVVIDASGSMGANAENLKALCKLIPTATIAYYSGGDGRGCGVLAVYAAKGKRYSGELPGDTMLGGNAVDLLALQWLLRHPKPWVLVSDLGFCGGVIGSEAVALALVDRLETRGDLTVHRSLEAAFEVYGAKLPGPMTPAEGARKKGVNMSETVSRRDIRGERK
jgi:hypothetical protein